MINLIKKEFIIQKRYVLMLLGYGIFMLIALSLSPGSFVESVYTVAGVATTYMFVQYSCAIDDKNNSEIIFNSLPISRRKIVFSKYASIIIFSVISVVTVGLLGMLIFKLPFIYLEKIRIEDIVGMLTAIWILTAIYLPIYFKFGYIKAKLFNMVIFFVFFSGALLLSAITEIFLQSSFIVSIINSISSKGTTVIGGSILLIAMIIVAISAIISTKVYSNREFN